MFVKWFLVWCLTATRMYLQKKLHAVFTSYKIDLDSGDLHCMDFRHLWPFFCSKADKSWRWKRGRNHHILQQDPPTLFSNCGFQHQYHNFCALVLLSHVQTRFRETHSCLHHCSFVWSFQKDH